MLHLYEILKEILLKSVTVNNLTIIALGKSLGNKVAVAWAYTVCSIEVCISLRDWATDYKVTKVTGLPWRLDSSSRRKRAIGETNSMAIDKAPAGSLLLLCSCHRAGAEYAK